MEKDVYRRFRKSISHMVFHKKGQGHMITRKIAFINRKSGILLLVLSSCLLIGCKKQSNGNHEVSENIPSQQPLVKTELITMTPIPSDGIEEDYQEEVIVMNPEVDSLAEPITEIVDYEEYFHDVKGCAVFYQEDEKKYSIYQEEMSMQQVSPYSTFKIISTLVGLDQGIIQTEESTMGYDGTIYQIEDWNYDLTLKDAFSYSCVWYFRNLVDQVGEITMDSVLKELKYGNCDVSEWEGSAINSYPNCNGFWLESSLKISPLEQVQVLSDIFEGKTSYKEEHISILKNVMLLQEEDNYRIYGKTGTGINNKGWFVGFLEQGEDRVYFASYLEDDQVDNITGKTAQTIVYEILEKEYRGIN